MDNAMMEEVLSAAEAGNKRKLNDLLGCKQKRLPQGTSLLPSSSLAQGLLDTFMSLLPSETVMSIASKPVSLTVDTVFGALLMIHSCYETPWVALLKLSMECLEMTLDTLYPCLSAANVFLQEIPIVSNNALDEGQSSTCTLWLVPAIEEISKRLLGESFVSRDLVECSNDRGSISSLVSDLFVGLVLSAKHCCDENKFQAIRHNLFRRDPDPTRVADWLRLVHILHSVSSGNDLQVVRSTLLKHVHRRDPKLSLNDWKEISGLAVILSRPQHIEPTEALFGFREMQLIPLEILICAQNDIADFVQLEQHMLATLTESSMNYIFESFNASLKDGDLSGLSSRCPDWIRLSVCMSFWQRIREVETTRISSLVKEALGSQSPPKMNMEDCQNRIIAVAFSQVDVFQRIVFSDVFVDESMMVEVFDELYYRSGGSFADRDGKLVKSFSEASGRVLDAIFVGAHHERSNESGRRASSWLQFLESCLGQVSGVLDNRTMFLSAVITTVVYYEIPAHRARVVSTILKLLSLDDRYRVRKLFCIELVALIARSSDEENSGFSDATVLNPLSQLLDEPPDNETFCNLAACMSSVSLARSLILLASSRLLNEGHFHRWIQDEEQERPAFNSSCKSGLFGLLELLHACPWDKEAAEAWIILSECMVMDNPPLALRERSWLYEEIKNLVVAGELATPVAEHFLRAAIIRAAKLLVQDDAESPIRFVAENAFFVWEETAGKVTQTKQTEDPTNLLRLILCLLFTPSGSVRPSRMILQAQGCYVLLNHVLDITNQRDDLTLTGFLKTWLPKIHHMDIFSVNFCCSMALFVPVLRYVLVSKSVGMEQSMVLFDRREANEIERALKLVMKQEKEAQVARIRHRPQTIGPTWLSDLDSDESFINSGETDVDLPWLASIRMSLYDILIEAVSCTMLPMGTPREQKSNQLSRDMVLCIGALLQEKYEACTMGEEMSQSTGSFTIDGRTINRTGPKFFSAASRVVQELLLRRSYLGDTEKVLSSIMLYCDAIVGLPLNSEYVFNIRLPQSVWALYQVIGGEKGAVQYVSYLESLSADTSRITKTDGSICSLKSLHSPADIDKSVQEIRLSILQAFQRCLQSLSSTVTDKFSFEDEESAFSGTARQTSAFDVEFLGSTMLVLVQDLRAGLDGLSGGITTEMFESFVQSIQGCTDIIQRIAFAKEVAILSAIPSALNIASDILHETLVSFPLQDAVLFRSSLIMATTQLPSLSKYITSRNAISGVRRFTQSPSHTDEGMVASLFTDCTFILARWSSLRDPNSMPWSDIAGQVHMVESNPDDIKLPAQFDHEEEVSMDSNLHIPEIVRIPQEGCGHHEKENRTNSFRIRLQTKEMWSWALSCTFVFLEQSWKCCLLFIVQKDFPTTKEISGVDYFSPIFEVLISDRSDCLFSLDLIARLFHSSTSTGSTGAPQVILEMLAMNLPSAPRLRLCHCIATMSKTLKLAIENFRLHVEAHCANNGDQSLNLSVLESLSCLSAWLVYDGQNLDFSVGIFRWLSILRRKRPPGEHPSKGIDLTELLPWVSNCSLLVRDLCAELKTLEGALQGYCVLDRSRVLKKALQTFFPGGGYSEMLRLTKRKIGLVEQAMPSDYSSRSMPDFPVISESMRSTKRRIRRHQPNSRPRNHRAMRRPQSRNRAVNVFMQMDQKHGKSAEGGVDAFIDLEDFLVPEAEE